MSYTVFTMEATRSHDVPGLNQHLYALTTSKVWQSAEGIAYALGVPTEWVESKLNRLSRHAMARYRTVGGVRKWQQ